ncbi:MAG: DNA polymerase Y family protein [Hyphomonas sp.]|uniref:DNA polymerase Y family protein n=1 Tax=Hyphomonas sp. TaxID=87 RepID=UPI0034A04B7A
MRRALSLWFPQLPLDRRVRLGDGRVHGAFAIVAEIRNAFRLTHLSETARAAGLTPGLSLTDARAICPGLLSEPSSPAREAALLRALHRWADIFSPRISIDPPDGLVLDITGCAHLFGGERAMAARLRAQLADLQVAAQTGIADTKGAAWALARFGRAPDDIAPPGEVRALLGHLPLAALGLDTALTHELRRTGLQTIGQLYEIRSSELARRFGLEVTSRLQRALGQTPEPVAASRAEPVWSARATLPEPIGYLADFEGVVLRLAEAICARLAAAGLGARRFVLTVRCVDTGDHVLVAGFAKPACAPGAVLQQFRSPLDKLKVEFGADLLRLVAELVEPLHPRQRTLDGGAETEEGWSDLVSTLGNRLGFDRVRLFLPADSHLPEREFTTAEAMNPPRDLAWKAGPRLRPVRLYDPAEPMRIETPGRPPLQFTWRRQPYETSTAEGPERLTPDWWREGDRRVRDYWRVQTRQGPRLWLVNYPGGAGPDWFVAGRLP